MYCKVLNYIFYKLDKRLSFGTFSSTGRNFTGRICVFHRGGGLKRSLRNIDYVRRINNFGFIFKIIKDFKYSSFLALIYYDSGFFSYITLSHGLSLGNIIYSGPNLILSYIYKTGSLLLLDSLNLFANIHNIELFPNFGAQVARAAGNSALFVSKINNQATLKLRSGWLINVDLKCSAVIGISSNINHMLVRIKNAGAVRRMGIRPTVRGVAMNPCDHPHGGGNGKSSPPKAAKTPWGKLTKGTHTKNKKADKLKGFLFKKVR